MDESDCALLRVSHTLDVLDAVMAMRSSSRKDMRGTVLEDGQLSPILPPPHAKCEKPTASPVRLFDPHAPISPVMFKSQVTLQSSMYVAENATTKVDTSNTACTQTAAMPIKARRAQSVQTDTAAPATRVFPRKGLYVPHPRIPAAALLRQMKAQASPKRNKIEKCV